MATTAAFQRACIMDDDAELRKLIHTSDVCADNEAGFRWACARGSARAVALLLSLHGQQRVNVHANRSEGLRQACANGHIIIVKMLLDLGNDRRACEQAVGEALATAKRNGDETMCKLLSEHMLAALLK